MGLTEAMPTRVLIADDHGMVRDGLRKLLDAERDIEVVALAEDGDKAVKLATELTPDVVVMDISMPVRNGIDATEMIRERVPTAEVLVLSIHSSREIIARALAAGARGYVLKESVAEELIRAIKTVAKGKRYLGTGVAEKVIDDYLDGRVGKDVLAGLSYQERQILQLVAEGKSNAETAAVLHLSTRTVETYRGRIMNHLNLDDLPALVRFAIRHGIVSLD